MTQQDGFTDPRMFSSVGLDRLGAKPLRSMDPRRVGPYAVLAVLGGGGMGRIYLGRRMDDAASELAAVKVIRPEYAEDEGFRKRFERESAALAKVQGEQAAVLLGSGYDGDLLWMATAYIPGPSLSEAVAASGPLSATGAWRLALELAQAIGAMERVGVVHRDIKPSNVILGPAGCRVIDFGISQAADTSAITTTGQQVGTPAYMSPEQVRGQAVATSSDLFALGSVLAFAVTGNGPFGDGTTVDVLHRVAFEEPKEEVLVRVEETDPQLAELVRACLDKDQAGRPSAADVAERAALRQVAAPWSAELSAAVMARVEVALAVQALPLPALDVPVTDDGTMLLGRAAAPTAPASAFGPAPVPVASPTPPTAQAPLHGPVRQTPPTVPVVPGPGPAQPPVPSPMLPSYVSVAQGAAPAQPQERRRGNRGVLLAVAAVLAVAALTGTAIAVTGGGGKPGGARTVAQQQQQGDGGTSSVDGVPTGPGASGSAAPSSGSSAAAAASASSGAPSTAHPGATAGHPGTSTAASAPAQAGGGPGGNPATTPASQPTTAAPTHSSPPPPSTPVWDQQCGYYSGSEETDIHGHGSTAAIKEVQCLLLYRGGQLANLITSSGGVDGQFGPGTQKAVETFQSCVGLSNDGGVGPQTWPALRGSGNC